MLGRREERGEGESKSGRGEVGRKNRNMSRKDKERTLWYRVNLVVRRKRRIDSDGKKDEHKGVVRDK